MVGTVNFGVELTNHACEQDHGNTRNQEHVDDPCWESPKAKVVFGIGRVTGFTGDVDSKDDQDDHELTSQQVSVEVITLVNDFTAAVGPLVRVSVQLAIDRSQSDDGTLSTLHHCQPDDGGEHDDHGSDGVSITRQLRLFGEDQSQDDCDTEHE